MPSQKQLKWSELKVGVTVVVAGLVLAVLIILMSGTGGLFTRKLILKSYFFDAQGLRVGAPVRLSGVDIGNVSKIRVVPNKPLAPVEVTMKVNGKYRFNLQEGFEDASFHRGCAGRNLYQHRQFKSHWS